MAALFVKEYSMLGREKFGGTGNNIQAPLEPAIRTQKLAIGASSVASEQFNNETTMVLVATDAICSVVFGTSPTATANDLRLAANTSQLFAVTPGGALKIAVITNT